MACESFYLWLRQFALLLWKNTIIQIRRPIGTLLELVLPCIFVIILIIIRYQLYVPSNLCAITTPTIPLQVSSFDVFYAPNDAQVNSIISRAEPVLSGGGTAAVNFTGYSNEADLLSAIEQYRSTNDIHGNLTFAGVVFPSNLSPSNTDITVTIRQKHEVPPSNSWQTGMLSTGDRNLLPATSSSRFGVESIMVN
jgi:ATP-binding cassette subfamily A (ABC1) protein 3